MSFMSIKQAYLFNIRNVLNLGTTLVDEKGKEVLELLNLITEIDFERYTIDINQETVKGSIWNGTILENYCKQLLDPEDKGFVYDYGNRLRGFDVDQIKYVIDKLKDSSVSRRAIAVTWRPNVDCCNDAVPCMILLDFKIRNKKLYIIGYWRSWDIYGASYANMRAIYNIGKHISTILEVQLANLTIYASSAHIYYHDIKDAEKILKEN